MNLSAEFAPGNGGGPGGSSMRAADAAVLLCTIAEPGQAGTTRRNARETCFARCLEAS